MKLRICFTSAIIVLLGACTQPAPTPTATASSTETIIPPSPTSAIGTPLPFTTSTPAIVIENPLHDATTTSSPALIPLTTEKVSILRPSDGSIVTSPLRVSGQAGPSYLDRIEFRLIGEDGGVIVSHFDFVLGLPGNLGPYNTEFEFTTSYLAEAARLCVINFDPIDGKMNHLTSVDLTLLSVSNPRTHYTIQGPEKLKITSLRENEIIDAGTFLVTGVGWPDTDQALHFEVTNSAEELIDSGVFKFNPHEIGVASVFEIEVTVEVETFQRVRIAVYEESDSIPGMLHYSSILVRVRP